MPAGLSAKIGADDREFSAVLERSGRRWKSFGRELDEGARGIGSIFGQTSKEVGKLGEGFKIAGAAAGIFAGADGLLGIAGSLAVGGPVLAGMAALTFAMRNFEKDAEDSKTAVEQFNKELGKIPQNVKGLQELERVQRSLQGALNAQRQAISAQATPAASAVGAAGLGSEIARQGGFTEFIKGLFGKSSREQTVAQLTEELNKATEQADDLRNALNTPEGQLKTMTERADQLRDILAAMTQAGAAGRGPDAFIRPYLSAWDEVNNLVREHGREVSKIGEIVRKLYEDFKNTPIFDLRGAQAAAAAANATVFGLRPSLINPAGPAAPNINQVRIGSFIAPTPRAIEILPPKIDHVAQAIEAGFAELPDALAGVLGPLIAGIFGNNRGAQVGGTLFGAFGGGAGSYIAGQLLKQGGALAGSALGAGIGSFIPVIGTAVGGLLGGAIGSLFGGHRKAVDYNTSALNANTAALRELLTNVPTGYKVGRAAYEAQTPVYLDGREITKAVVANLRRESQAQFGTSMRWAEVSL